MSRWFLGALLLGSFMTFGAAARAEETETLEVEASSPVNQDRPQVRDDSRYYHPSTEPTVYKPNPKLIVQQKSMARGQQRADRIAAMNWYGMSNSRPTAQPTPFCSMYSPAWQSGSGQPFSWNQGRPTYIFR